MTVFLVLLVVGVVSLRLDPLSARAQQGDQRLDGRLRPQPPGQQERQAVEQTLRIPAFPRLTTVRAIGLDTARARLGRQMPRGHRVIAGHVEGSATAYMPDVEAPFFRQITFVPRTGPSTKFDHATATARIIYGRGGLAPGIRTVHAFSSLEWIGDDYLRTSTELPPLEDDPIRVFSHSWITDETRGIEQVLRRVDYQIDTRDVVMAVGVNNGEESQIPAALASAYNVIAVGSINGRSSRGTTRLDGVGRSKPDIVAPGGMTSFTTPAVAAAAAMLIEAGEVLDEHADLAQRSEVIKAILMAGATKPDSWEQRAGRPLADQMGAGLLNIDNALKILQSGAMALPDHPAVDLSEAAEAEVEEARIVRRFGWAVDSLERHQSRRITLKANRLLGPISIMLVWNRQIRGEVVGPPFSTRPVWLPRPLLSDVDIKLLALPDEEAGPEAAATVYAESSSRVDNVEHLYIEALPPGEYELVITRHPFPLTYEPAEQEVALAWRIELPSDQPAVSEAAD